MFAFRALAQRRQPLRPRRSLSRAQSADPAPARRFVRGPTTGSPAPSGPDHLAPSLRPRVPSHRARGFFRAPLRPTREPRAQARRRMVPASLSCAHHLATESTEGTEEDKDASTTRGSRRGAWRKTGTRRSRGKQRNAEGNGGKTGRGRPEHGGHRDPRRPQRKGRDQGGEAWCHGGPDDGVALGRSYAVEGAVLLKPSPPSSLCAPSVSLRLCGWSSLPPFSVPSANSVVNPLPGKRYSSARFPRGISNRSRVRQ